MVTCYPHVVLREEGALGLDAAWCGEEFLGGEGRKFVGYGVSGVWVEFGGVGDFEDAVVSGVGVVARGVGDCGFVDLVEVAVGVCGWVLWDGVRFFVGDGVGVAVDCWVDACFVVC